MNDSLDFRNLIVYDQRLILIRNNAEGASVDGKRRAIYIDKIDTPNLVIKLEKV